jgi:type IV pilus assembly protein PilV
MKVHRKFKSGTMKLVKNQLQNKGFTLIELLIAIMILSFGILAVAAMQVSALKANGTTRSMITATTWATDQLEKLNDLAYLHSNLNDTDGDGTAGLDDATSATADYQITQGMYTIYWNVAVDTPTANNKTVSVIVTWMDGTRQKRVSLQDLIANI